MAETSVPKAMENLQISKTKELKGTEKRDGLIALERKYQAQWEADKVFEADAPSRGTKTSEQLHAEKPKYMSCFAYPYMNGSLHVGHAFTISKVEFGAGFERLLGKNVLFPLGYHCTGLPIKAASDKLIKEVEMFGQEFQNYKEEEEVVEEVPAPAPTKAAKEDPTKFTAKKGKAAAKKVNAKYQFQILESIGIPREDIHRFADAQYWLEFFPPICKRDLSNFGARIDWRRQFVTTDANPYYDSFVRWQMIRLKELGKVKFGKRYTIFSLKDMGPTMDHDRSEGEGVNPQEYTALKLKVLEYAPKFAEAIKGKIPSDASVYLVPATLRPETMYGQTCCFVGPKLSYGLYKAAENSYFLITERAARNMCMQGIFEKDGPDFTKVADVKGSDVVGTLVNAPLSLHTDGVRVLPMESVLPTKGTGVVTSVPSDSPDDYATVMDLAKKADYYGIKKEWAELEIYPIIDTPSYGDKCAEFLVKKLKIASPKDVKPLAEAKELAYKEGFYQGVLKVGDYKGEKVETAKPKVRQDLIDAGLAFAYAEPENKVVARSGDECTVALMDQWYLDYGEDSWRAQALEYVDNKDGKGLNTFTYETKNQFEAVLNWLNQWACARGYGLGSKLPWDHTWLVESLSDSTIYMSYYTVAHFLHSDLFGRQKGLKDIRSEQMTDEVWDYIFCRAELTDKVLESKISKQDLEELRSSFEYWYPLDLRASGKDLIGNHLTFFIYNHIALFPREYWPKAIRANGHLMLNNAKMSKSTGNFLTLNETVQKYGADAARIALADAGDGINDANFEEDVADASILRLFNNKEWIEEVIKDKDQLRTGELNDFQDALFDNEMNGLVHEARKHYEETNYKLALKAAWYDFLAARDFYREACATAGIPMHKELVWKWIELQALLLAPIAPHWCEHLWVEFLQKKEPKTIQFAAWPEVPAADIGLTAAREFVRSTASAVNSAEAQQVKRMAKGRQAVFDPKKPKKLTIFTAENFPAWQAKYVDLLRELWDPATSSFTVDDKALNGRIEKAEMKKAMPFVQNLKKRLKDGEPASAVLDRKLTFDEKTILRAMTPALQKTAVLAEVDIIAVTEGSTTGKLLTADGGQREIEVTSPNAETALPGNPSFFFENV